MISHNQPSLHFEEQDAMARVLESGWIAQGPEVDAFENELCDFFELPIGHAVVVSSGSAALYLALWALNGRNKHIGLPVYSCAALRNAINLIGGRCIYLDCASNSPNINPTALTASFIDILIAPSIFGIPVELSTKLNCKIIEDVAQALGASSYGKRIGLRGDIGICSFYATKMITSGGQGGAIISHDMALIDAIRDYREFDCRDDKKLRFNFQMTDIQAAVGRVQLNHLPHFIEQRDEWFSLYQSVGLNLVDGRTDQITPVRYRIVMRTSEPNRVIKSLALAGIRAIVPVEINELLDDPWRYPMAANLTKTSVSLPAYPNLSKEVVGTIARIAKEAE